MLASLFLGFTTLFRFTIRIADVQNLHFRPIGDIQSYSNLRNPTTLVITISLPLTFIKNVMAIDANYHCYDKKPGLFRARPKHNQRWAWTKPRQSPACAK